MEPSELPPFPTPEPPHPAPAARLAGRGMPMFLQALFLLAFWPAIYITHEQSAAMIAAEQKAREKEQREQEQRERTEAVERITAHWDSDHEEGWIIRFRDDRFAFWLTSNAIVRGTWRYENGMYILQSPDLIGCWRARIVDNKLLIEHSESGEEP